jgi:hypothetical protein
VFFRAHILRERPLRDKRGGVMQLSCATSAAVRYPGSLSSHV